MQHSTANEIICDFDDKHRLDMAVSELEEHHFNKDDMGIEKTVQELKSLSPQLDGAPDSGATTKPWRIRDSVKDIAQQNRLMGGLISLVGLGLFVAAIVAVFNLERIQATQEMALFVILMAIGLILGGIGLSRWMIRDTKQQFKEQVPEGMLRFWIKTPDEASKRDAMSILKRYGATHIEEHYHAAKI